MKRDGVAAELEEVHDTERHRFSVACTRARDRRLVTGVHLRPLSVSPPLSLAHPPRLERGTLAWGWPRKDPFEPGPFRDPVAPRGRFG